MKKVYKFILRKQPIWLLVLLFLFFFSIINQNFLTFGNVINMLWAASIYGFMAIGITFLMINGNIDLSIGSVLGLAAAISIVLQPYGIFLAVAVALISGLIIGVLNGLFVSKVGINSFIVTLAAMIGIRGIIYVVTKEQSKMGTNIEFANFGLSNIGSIPTIVILFIGILLIADYVLRHTRHGRNAYAVGGNIVAAKNAGIQVNKHIFINFIICSLLAAIAGVLLASRMNAATPTFGEGYELLVITAVVLGGTKLQGGYGSIFQTLGGVLVIGILQNGLDLMGIQAYYHTLITGIMLIIVIFIDKRIQLSRA